MNEEKKDMGTFVVALLIFIMVAIPIVALSFMDYMQDDYEIERLRNEIKNKQDVSNEYIQGWNDCISKLISIRNEVTNITANVMNNTN